MASDTVWIPGRNGRPASFTALANAGVQPGLTPKRAPAAIACFTCASSSTVPAPTTASGTSRAMAARASSAAASPESDLQHRQAALDQRPGERHGVGHPLDREDRDDRRQGGDGRDIHGQTLQPPSMTFTVPVVKAASSLAR